MAQIVQYPADRTPAKSFVASLLAYCMHDPENTFLNPHHPSQTANFPFYLCTYLLIQLKRPMIYLLGTITGQYTSLNISTKTMEKAKSIILMYPDIFLCYF